MRRSLSLLPIALTLLVAYFLRAPLLGLSNNIIDRYFPCSRPLTYSIREFDERFGISREEFLAAVAEAEAVWEGPVNKELFAARPEGRMALDLIYDDRQAATERLLKLDGAIETNRQSYDILAENYRALKASYDTKNAALGRAISAYDANKKAYEARVAYWNARGGAPPREYAALEAERKALNQELAGLSALEKEVNEIIATLNAAVDALNRLARDLNITARTYNRIGAERGDEFEEGIFESGPQGTSITIYEFENREKLVRVLAHELGHALGLQHIDEPEAIMYRLNQSDKATAAAADIAALRTRCSIE